MGITFNKPELEALVAALEAQRLAGMDAMPRDTSGRNGARALREALKRHNMLTGLLQTVRVALAFDDVRITTPPASPGRK